MSLKRERSPSPSTSSNVYWSTTVKEQTSTFIAAYSPSRSAKALQALLEFKTATHKIAAWRKRSRQLSLKPETKVIFDLGHDDDGERWAGGRVSNVLKDNEIEGAVVVARWYGGQNIGPIRFTHIENCAKDAIRKWRIAEARVKEEQVSKKQKSDEVAKKKELVNNLQERDYNIFALRKLLAQKRAKLQDEELAPPTPQKPQAYETMNIDALLRVDKARDATIAFILKEIDKIDEQLKLVEDLEDVDVLEGGTQESWKDAQEHIERKDQAPSTPK